jgi:hypothetical protein
VYQDSFGDLQSEDLSVAAPMWDQTRHALHFFREYLPFEQMEPNNTLASNASGALVLADLGETYAVYLPAGGAAYLDLGATTATFDVYWYNPRTGGSLLRGSVSTIRGPGRQALGTPPADPSRDWTVLVHRRQ